MSTQYPGGFITKTPVVPSGGYETSTASGIWTVDQALQYVKQGIWPTQGVVPLYIENVFSSFLYTGTGATRTITNGINLSANGGLVWSKQRNGVSNHFLFDTSRGVNNGIMTSSTAAQASYAASVTSFNTTGFSLGSNGNTNNNLSTYVSWTFQKKPKFFDLVTFTTDGSGGGTFSHSLGAIPGCSFLKGTALSGDWFVYHRSLSSANYALVLNSTVAESNVGSSWISWTTTTFTIDNSTIGLNANSTYVIYIFAHNAGGFGLSAAENAISCGSFTTNASAVSGQITLGYEPQWLLIKRRSGAGNWFLIDNMRGVTATGNGGAALYANDSSATDASRSVNINATGFSVTGDFGTSSTSVYVAIRRGLMAIPTIATNVFSPSADATGDSSISTGFPVDMAMDSTTTAATNYTATFDRLRQQATLATQTTAIENTNVGAVAATTFQNNTGITPGLNGQPVNVWSFRRAPNFFDIVCYTGTGAVATQTHNLTVAPEMMIVRKRNVAADWEVYHSALGATKVIELNLTGAESVAPTRWNDTAPTASVFTVGTHTTVNASGANYVAYLFATLANISKVGSYTGTAALQTIACGFTTGARFVLIKRSNSTGDWYVWNSASGITSSTDPYFLLNSTAAEVGGTNYVDTDTTGFKVTAAANTTVNISGSTYIFLAIA